jgi:hypothetical protein
VVEIESSIGQDFSLMAMFERTLFAARGRQVSPLHAHGAYVAFFLVSCSHSYVSLFCHIQRLVKTVRWAC